MAPRLGDPTSSGSVGRLFGEATLLHQRGRLEEAAKRYQQVLLADRCHFDSMNLFGVLRAQQGNFAEAVGLLRQAISRDPASAAAHNNLGMTLNLAERHREAVAPLEQAIALAPRDPIAYNNLGVALQALGRHQPAATALQRAVELKPDYVEALSNLGGALHALGRFEEAIPWLEKALTLNPGFAGAHVNLGVVLRALDRPTEAKTCFDRALAADPRNILAYDHIGGMYLETGRFAEARRCYERALAIQPRNTRILFHLVQCGKLAATDPCIPVLESMAADPAALADEQRTSVLFALGKIYADLEQHERSFGHYLQANTVKRRQTNYDEAADLGLFDRIREVFSAELIASRKGLGHPSDRPVFVLGMMRSGSTLVEQILATHPNLFGAGERPDFNEAYKAVRKGIDSREHYPETVRQFAAEQFHRLGEFYLNRLEPLAPSSGIARITDKMPGNFSAIGLIHLALPNARIIHTVRDPIDTCLSCFSKLFANGQPFTYDLGELGRYYRAYRRLMDHWQTVLPEGTILHIRYEDLVADFEPQARRLVAFCGLEWDDACLSFYDTDRMVRTASQVQVRQALYRSSVRRWRPAAETLRPLLEGLDFQPGSFASAAQETT